MNSMERNYSAVYISLIVLLFSIYSNSFNNSWHFDDKPNIIDNPFVHINSLETEKIWRSGFSLIHNSFFRPVPYLSFALNWYLGGDNVSGYHIVNILIHIITALSLFHLVLCIFKTPTLKNRYTDNDSFFVAFLSAVLWAVNPLQTQAVNYIVQRMTLLSGMFTILSILFYIKGRLENDSRKKNVAFLLCFLFWLFGVLSKENAFMTPFAFLLVETAFFDGLNKYKRYRSFIRYIFFAFIVTALMAIFWVAVVKKGDFLFFLNGYKDRPFTAYERILTETRILFFYLSQIFYPTPERLSITHDFTVSKGLFSPWTTILSVSSIIMILLLCLLSIKKKALICFSVLFFFINHVIESTFLPLELVFEHRNYLPSMFLFLPVSLFVKTIINRYRTEGRIILFLLCLLVTVTVISWGIWTYHRNTAWKNEITLWADAMKKAPLDGRPPWNLAYAVSIQPNISRVANKTVLDLYHRSLSLNMTRKSLYPLLHKCIGLTYFTMQDYIKAAEYYSKSLELNPDLNSARFQLALSYMYSGHYEKASNQSDILISKTKGLSAEYTDLKGFTLLWLGRPDESLRYLRVSLFLSGGTFTKSLLNTGCAYGKTGDYKKSFWFLKRAQDKTPEDIIIYLCMLENAVKSNEYKKITACEKQLFSRFPITYIISTLKKQGFTGNIPLDYSIIMPHIERKCHFNP